jgi:bifunctional DNA-binding transcriptional regulator/antitoxin component of YhaV-PrlF toxin-antitoxin module
MNKKGTQPEASKDSDSQSHKVEAILAIDARGQILIPKDVREQAQMNVGDKLALISHIYEEKICCLYLIPVNDLSTRTTELMHHILSE